MPVTTYVRVASNDSLWGHFPRRTCLWVLLVVVGIGRMTGVGQSSGGLSKDQVLKLLQQDPFFFRRSFVIA